MLRSQRKQAKFRDHAGSLLAGVLRVIYSGYVITQMITGANMVEAVFFLP